MLISSQVAPTKFVPWSLQITEGLPCRAINLRQVAKNLPYLSLTRVRGERFEVNGFRHKRDEYTYVSLGDDRLTNVSNTQQLETAWPFIE